MADREPPDRHPALRVVRAGILDLLVDSGRRGWQRFGMPPGGPADEESFHLAGVLAGAGAGAPGAAIEVTAAGP
ncbi:MAG TPA: urea carboxylase, partial [Candidatus Dormibacteraeota bacterium]|nr:urea carboxylase [Candidatus Dormibacteraeota bacterium]